MMINIHRQEVISLRRPLVHTANGRLDVKRRIADAERWVNALSKRFGIVPTKGLRGEKRRSRTNGALGEPRWAKAKVSGAR